MTPEPCVACNHAHDHGWWGKGTLPKDTDAHCRSCHVSWPGSQTWGHCVSCHQMFRSVSAFDRHQMVAGCPKDKGTVSDIAADVSVALIEYAASQIEDGKRHYLVQNEHPNRGFHFWGWHRDS